MTRYFGPLPTYLVGYAPLQTKAGLHCVKCNKVLTDYHSKKAQCISTPKIILHVFPTASSVLVDVLAGSGR